jgi:Flp pilus assembly protein TadB
LASRRSGAKGLFAPTDHYDLWLRASDGTERQFTVQTREMPARRGHEVSLITTTHRRPRVLALAHWMTIAGVNRSPSEPPGLVRVADMPWLAVGLVGMTAWLVDAVMVQFLPVAVVVLAAVASSRWSARRRLAWRMDRAIDLETWRTAKWAVPTH